MALVLSAEDSALLRRSAREAVRGRVASGDGSWCMVQETAMICAGMMMILLWSVILRGG